MMYQGTTEETFDGETYVRSRDGRRLTAQYTRVFALMCDGLWRSLMDISDVTGDPWQSVSARLRDMRKRRFGGHTVERTYVADGIWEYRLLLNDGADDA